VKYAAWLEGNKDYVGVVVDEKIHPLTVSLKELISMEQDDLLKMIESSQETAKSISNVTFLPCVPEKGKIICVGLNYKKHAEEAGMAVPQFPVLFNKFSNALAANNEEIILPAVATEFDYEAELGVVIGKRAKNIAKENALEHVFGYCNVNDLSARDLQMRTAQWMLGKSLDGFCPIGPYIVTSDEVGNPNDLDIRLYVNDEIRQNSNTKDMIFKVDEIVSYVSRYITLEPGDLIITGTPEGVIAGFPADKKHWLQPGDIVTVEIEKLGRLNNQLKGET
jgi:2-keto-4-pentenoate hydratase/2-oxohepta-3-ene-1,7-dioic acid hydratase in catechol pathway